MKPSTKLLAEFITIGADIQRRADAVTSMQHFDMLTLWALVQNHGGRAQLSEIRVGSPALSPERVTKVVKRLDKAGLVSTSKDLINRQVVWIEITRAGTKRAAALEDEYERIATEFLTPLTELDRMALRRAVQRLGEAL